MKELQKKLSSRTVSELSEMVTVAVINNVMNEHDEKKRKMNSELEEHKACIIVDSNTDIKGKNLI
jgi:hypothetical protein